MTKRTLYTDSNKFLLFEQFFVNYDDLFVEYVLDST